MRVRNVIFDDMIDTAGTITRAAAALPAKAQIPSMLVSYPRYHLPSGWALRWIDKEVIVTDSIQQPEGQHLDKLKPFLSAT